VIREEPTLLRDMRADIECDRRSGRQDPGCPADRLGSRQREILFLISKGLRNAEIAAQIGVTEATVKYHVSRLLAIFDLTNRTELASEYAVEAARRDAGAGSGTGERPPGRP